MNLETLTRPAPRSLADVRDPHDPFPKHLLQGCETALILFSAMWHGRQDAVHCADAGLKGTCVDVRAFLLDEMRQVYPDDWQFVDADAYAFVEAAAVEHDKWDIVTVDCPTGQFEKCGELAHWFCAVANRAVVLGCGTGTDINVPKGWEITSRVYRSGYRGGVYWAVLEPC